MNPKKTKHPLPDFDGDLENDAVWNLLEESPSAEASPHFAQDTLRRVRLDAAAQKAPWWRALLSPKPCFAAASISVAALALFLSLPSNSVAPPDPQISSLTEPATGWAELEEAVANELLSNAAEDPSLLSDAELVALLY